MHANLIDLTGKKFNRLLVIGRAGTHTAKGGHRFVTWHCICDCGKPVVVTGMAIKAKKNGTRSCGCINRNPDAPRNAMFRRYKKLAILRKMPFDLTKDHFFSLIVQECHYCGGPPTVRKSAPLLYAGFKANGVDRLDSLKGYVVDNVVPCCALCNQAKNDLSVDEFLGLARRIYLHSFK